VISVDEITLSVRQLAELLERLIERHDALHAALRSKLEAMRRSDVDAMLAASRREREIVAAVQAGDGQRRELVSSLYAALMPERRDRPDAREVTLRELAARVAPDQREELSRLAARLRDRMLVVGEANRAVELVCREMLAHFKSLFAAMVCDGRENNTYRGHGAPRPVAGARVLDAVG
jgi:hypothetical protein